MRRNNRSLTTWMAAILVLCASLSAGCQPVNWFGSNFSLYIALPLGLGGSPGLLNPFGIVQAIVNSLLGVQSSSVLNESASYPTASSSPSAVYSTTIPAIIAR